MVTISLCMIVKNEEDVLSRCLDCVKGIVDEIIIVDTGSKDSTKEIALRYTENVYDFEWIDDFSAARNYSFSKATMEYIMWLDADDVLLPQDRRGLIECKSQLDKSIDIVMMKYNVAFDAQDNPTLTYYRERILLRSKNYKWVSPIHEVITPSGNIIYSDIAVTHKKLRPSDSNRNLYIFEVMLSKGQKLDPRQQFYYARELYYHARYQDAITEFTSFLDNGKGWTENNISACQDLAKCYRLSSQPKLIISTLFRSLEFDTPRAEICCAIGEQFLLLNKYKIAVFWYETATNKKKDDQKGGFSSPDSYEFTPYMQLCVCYDKLGDFKTARNYHDKTKLLKPDHPSVKYNEEYFSKIQEKCQ